MHPKYYGDLKEIRKKEENTLIKTSACRKIRNFYVNASRNEFLFS